MKIFSYVLFFCICSGCVTYVALANGKSDKDLSTLKKNVKKINSGFVFIEGKYISMPYMVTVKKGWLNINLIPVKKISEWPLSEESPNKPLVPAKVLANAKSSFDLELWKYSAKMYRWLERNNVKMQKKKEEWKNFYESAPFVKKVEFPNDNSLEMKIFLKNGTVEEWGGDGEAVEPIVTIKEQVENLENQRERMEKCLADNDVFFFFPENKGELTFGDNTIAESFNLLLKILASDRPEKEKLNILFRMMIIPENESKNGLVLIRNCKPSKELNARVGKVVDQFKIKDNNFHPYTLKDIPKELPSEILKRQHRKDKHDDEKLNKKEQ